MNITLNDGTKRRGQILEVNGDKAVVQVSCFALEVSGFGGISKLFERKASILCFCR